MEKSLKKQVLKRMNYLTGHLEGTKKMLEEDRYCIDIILQNKAVISAIKKVNQLILANHLSTCVTEAIKGQNKREQKRKIKEILDLFENSNEQ